MKRECNFCPGIEPRALAADLKLDSFSFPLLLLLLLCMCMSNIYVCVNVHALTSVCAVVGTA